MLDKNMDRGSVYFARRNQKAEESVWFEKSFKMI